MAKLGRRQAGQPAVIMVLMLLGVLVAAGSVIDDGKAFLARRRMRIVAHVYGGWARHAGGLSILGERRQTGSKMGSGLRGQWQGFQTIVA